MPQESRTERISAAVSRLEKPRIAAVAKAMDKDVSNLLRVMPIDAILAEWDRLPPEQKRAA